MKRYRIKSTPGHNAFLEISGDAPGGYRVTVTRHYDGYETVEEDFMSKELLETCLRTAYLEELDSELHPAMEVAS